MRVLAACVVFAIAIAAVVVGVLMWLSWKAAPRALAVTLRRPDTQT